MQAIAHSKPWIDETDVQAVAAVLRGGMVVQGERTRELERALCRWHGLPEESGVAVASGAAAVLASLLALGVGAGDEVVLPTYVCHTVLEAVGTTGARPIVCDVGERWVVTPADVESHVTSRTRALIVPHLYGLFADVGAFRRFGVAIVEDCAQALGPRGRRLEGDLAVFSFHATKCLTTGEGGLAVATRPELAPVLRAVRDARFFSRLPDTSGALGLSQLARYETSLARRRELWLRYRERLERVIPWVCEGYPFERSMFFRFVLRVRGGVDAHGPAFLERGIHVRRGVDRLNHRLLGLPDRDFPVAVRLFETTLSLPLYPALTDAEHERCADAAAEILAGAQRG